MNHLVLGSMNTLDTLERPEQLDRTETLNNHFNHLTIDTKKSNKNNSNNNNNNNNNNIINTDHDSDDHRKDNHGKIEHTGDKNFTIAFYDSGLGGFSVVKECVALYPEANIIYIADTAYCPLGTKPKSVIKQRVEFALKTFSEMGADYSIIACNTASINGLNSEMESDNVLGTVTAMCREAAIQLSGIEAPSILILGTTQTIKSNIYTDRLQALFPNGYIEGLATDPFVTLVEESAEDINRRITVVAETLKRRKLETYDAVVMGCTHFPFLQHEIKMALGEEIKVINPALQIAKSLKLTETENRLKQVSVISTGYTPNYDAVPFVSKYIRSINQTV